MINNISFFGLVGILFVIIYISMYVIEWFYKSTFNYVGANQLGIRILFGKADEKVYTAGTRLFVPYLPPVFKCGLYLYPTQMIHLDYDPIKVISKSGNYPTHEGKYYTSVELTIKSMAYLNFPREREMLVRKTTDSPVAFLKDLNDAQRTQLDVSGETTYHIPEKDGAPAYDVVVILERTHPLINILRAGVPTTTPELKYWSEKSVSSSVRSAAARITWKEANEDPRAFKDKLEQSYLNVDGILIQAGFRPNGIKLAVELIDLPKEVKDAMAGEEAAAHVAMQESTEVSDALVAMVDKQIGAMRKHCDLNKDEILKIRQECLNQLTRDRTMKGNGTLIDARVSNADGTPFGQGSVSEIVGGIVAAVLGASANK